jgi:tellurite resistance protein TerC
MGRGDERVELVTVAEPIHWVVFMIFVLGMLALDLGVFHRRAHVIRSREALVWTVVWIVLALFFAAGIYVWAGSQKGLEFLTGYVVEKALSVDNLFVILVIFTNFAVPRAYQHRVLFWGIAGALVTRAIFILAGSVLLHTFHWLIYVFGAFLLFTGIRLLGRGETPVHPERNPIVRWAAKVIPSVTDYQGPHFIVKRGAKHYATPLLLVLLTVEATDVIFAVDSIPAVFAVTEDPFIVFTSNIFAILGLRSLYFVLADMLGKFSQLKTGLSLVLAYVGIKMLISGVFPIPIGISLLIIVVLLGGSVAASFVRRGRTRL